MYRPWLETKIAANPFSPFFARMASHYLTEGRAQQALDLCQSGVKAFPGYATGHLVLGKCYETLGRNIEAMLEYRKALKSVPDNQAVRALLKNVETREQEAFKAFSEERTRKLEERKGSITFERYLAENAPDKETAIDFVLKRLHDARLSSVALQEAPPLQSAEPATPAASKIVTATLAEIYASQGEYGEAIEAYRKLLEQRPVEAKRYEKRITQLEELTKLQQVDQRP